MNCIKVQVSRSEPSFHLDGGVSLTSFTLRRVSRDPEVEMFTPKGEFEHSQMDPQVSGIDDAKLARSLRRRPWVNYGMFDCSSDEDPDLSATNLTCSPKPALPKGLIRGCSDCTSCQKVLARWRPQARRKPIVSEAPVFYPNDEEFEDPLKYISSIQKMVEPYGICRIVPPSSWKPPCPLKEKNFWETAKFMTRIQQLDKLQSREPMQKKSNNSVHGRRKRRKYLGMGMPSTSPDASTCVLEGIKGPHVDETFGFIAGPEFTLSSFEKYATDFFEQYFGLKDEDQLRPSEAQTYLSIKPSIEDIEGEYWRIVEKPTAEMEVLYGADLNTATFGSGFPKESCDLTKACMNEYVKSGWNLNNIARLPGSVLSFEKSDISGVLVPWLYIGMCFSSFCWHVEDHHFYSVNYMHWGAPKLWYGVPGSHALKLEAAMKKHLPDLFEEQPDLLHKLVTQLSPSILISEGVPVYRCVQHSGEFVITFPRAYHSGFNSGFNCAEAVNFAPVDWLPHGQHAIELYSQQHRQTSVSHDKLLLGAVQQAIRALWELLLLHKDTQENKRWQTVCGKDGTLTSSLKTRIEKEDVRRKFFCIPSQSRKMDADFDKANERECCVCFYDLHLSAAGCECSPNRFSCLSHAKQLCSCAWSSRFFLFRYEMSELNVCLDAVGGNLSAISRWASVGLGLFLSSFVTKRESKLNAENQSASPDSSLVVATNSDSAEVHFSSSGKANECSKIIAENGDRGTPAMLKTDSKTSGVGFASNDYINGDKTVKEERSNLFQHPNNKVGVHSIARHSLNGLNNSYTETPVGKTNGNLPKQLQPSGADVICLSDSEEDESNKTGDPHSNNSSNPSKNVDLSVKAVSADGTTARTDKVKDVLPSDEVKQSHTDRGRTDWPEASTSHNDLVYQQSGRSRQISQSEEIDAHGLHSEHHQSTAYDESCHGNEAENVHIVQSKDSANECNSQAVGSSRVPSLENLDGKSPQIATVPRFKSHVEALEFGLGGRAWCDTHAIFPEGFRSRVKYFSVRDPTQMCYYISEVLNGLDLLPLFRVTVDDSPTIIFSHFSINKCWDMVRERVNEEIKKQQSLGKSDLPVLQLPGSVDGYEMFGFTSPNIIKSLEALDQNHLCSEYWNVRAYGNGNSFSRVQMKTGITTNDNDIGKERKLQKAKKPTTTMVLEGLFKKSTPEELNALHSVLCSDKSCSIKELAIQALEKEILDRS